MLAPTLASATSYPDILANARAPTTDELSAFDDLEDILTWALLGGEYGNAVRGSCRTYVIGDARSQLRRSIGSMLVLPYSSYSRRAFHQPLEWHSLQSVVAFGKQYHFASGAAWTNVTTMVITTTV